MVPFQNRSLDRRTVLRGIGASLALPWLDAVVPALRTRSEPRPLRCVFVFAPNGKKMDEWKPAAAGRNFTLPYLLEPLQGVRSRLTVFSGLAIDGGRGHGDGPGDHARAAASFLTCAHPFKTGGADIRVGTSIDQVIAARVGHATEFPSLQLGMEKGSSAGACDSGYSCAYSNNVSWRDESTPLAKATSPRAVFTRLFGDPAGVQGAADAARERRRRASVLDAVQADAKALAGRLGPADRRKLDQYLGAVRELEQRLARTESVRAEVAVPRGLVEAGSFPEQLDLMYELLAMAIATDRTRIASFMLGNAGSNRSYPFLDVPQGHHEVSHHGKQPDKLAAIRRINRFHVEALARFLGSLEGRNEEGESLLARTHVVYASGIGDGDRHNHDNLPVLLCGGGRRATAGQHVDLGRETPMANLYLAIAQAMGLEISSFADSTGALAT